MAATGPASRDRFDTVWRSLIPAAMVIGAGLVAYAIEAAGEFGPNVVYGRADANAAIPLAWIQLPVHAGLAFLLVIGRPHGPLRLAWAAARVGLMLLVVWAAFWTFLLIETGSVPRVGVLNSTLLTIPLLLYGAALYLTLENGARHARVLFARMRMPVT